MFALNLEEYCLKSVRSNFLKIPWPFQIVLGSLKHILQTLCGGFALLDLGLYMGWVLGWNLDPLTLRTSVITQEVPHLVCSLRGQAEDIPLAWNNLCYSPLTSIPSILQGLYEVGFSLHTFC